MRAAGASVARRYPRRRQRPRWSRPLWPRQPRPQRPHSHGRNGHGSHTCTDPHGDSTPATLMHMPRVRIRSFSRLPSEAIRTESHLERAKPSKAMPCPRGWRFSRPLSQFLSPSRRMPAQHRGTQPARRSSCASRVRCARLPWMTAAHGRPGPHACRTHAARILHAARRTPQASRKPRAARAGATCCSQPPCRPSSPSTWRGPPRGPGRTWSCPPA
jgi:hypothetical protein